MNASTVALRVADKTRTLVPVEAKSGNHNTYFAETTSPTRFGYGVPALADKLPKKVVLVVDGESQDIHLSSGVTQSSNAKMAYQGAVTLPSGEVQQFRVSISETKDGSWNLIARLTHFGTGGRSVDEGAWS